ncbi:MAG: histone deacetylase [Nitrospirota bacterium]|nr:histone deacetylase [Nitrospirota bacterium]
MKTGYITHPDFLAHDTGDDHPESPRRLSVLDEHILGQAHSPLQDQLKIITPKRNPALYRWISEIHIPSYIDALKNKIPTTGRIYLDADTPYSPGSLKAAEMAVSGVLTAVDQVMDGTLNNAFCALRPPGHHAEPDRAMGFCLFNNVAVAARYIQKKHHLPKIFIIDWDVHHGNGTQNAFYDDASVFYLSSHQFPCYPGTGSTKENGQGLGEGTTLNLPLHAGTNDAELLRIFEKVLPDTLATFQPDFILISAGFDAHRDDPLAALEITDTGFAEMTNIVRSLAETHCQGRIVSCLEGGYHLHALAQSVKKHLSVLSKP